jgi:DNA-binding response OmpR family regulator
MQSKGKAVLGDVIVDFDRMEILCRSQSIPATSLEFRLLKFFIDNPNRTFSREELIRAVWKRPKREHSRAVDTCIWNLRRKVEKDLATPIFFQTVHGEGYRFVSTKLPQDISGTQSLRGSCSR